jgi:hypothetical protein
MLANCSVAGGSILTLAVLLRTFSPAMIARIAAYSLLIALFVLRPDFPLAADAQEISTKPPAASRQFILLRNGEVFSGELSEKGEFYVVVNSGSEVNVVRRDVDVVCQSLDDVYRLKQSRLAPGQIDDRLNLADWCLRQNLFGYAAHELSAALQLDPNNRKAQYVDRRLQLAMAAATAPSAETKPGAASRRLPATPEELDRLVRCLPSGTVENFTSIVQPMLVNSCATAGCHGPSSQSKYTLIRTAGGSTPAVRVTQRNLHSTIQWIDNNHPAESKLLAAAREPHGNNATPAASLDSAKYQELVVWVTQVSQYGNNPAPMDAVAGRVRHVKPVRQNATPTTYSPPGSIGSAVPVGPPASGRSVFHPPAHKVASTRATAPATQSADAPNALPIPQPEQHANVPTAPGQPPVFAPRTAPATPTRASSDEIPNANEVFSTRN